MSALETRDLSPFRRVNDDPPGAADVAEAIEEEEVNLRDYLRVVVKHLSLIAVVVVLSVASTGLVNFVKTPRYTSTATIQIERQAPKFAPVEAVEQSETVLSADKYDYYQTQYEVLESRSIAARVIKGLGVETDPHFEAELAGGFLDEIWRGLKALFVARGSDEVTEHGVRSSLVEHYLDWLKISPVTNSRLVRVGFASTSPELSARIANRHVDEYVAANLDHRLDTTLKAKEFLETELAKAKLRVDAAELALNNFRKEKRIVSLDGSRSDVVSERLGDLNKEFTAAQAERIKLESRFKLVRNRDLESLPDVASSPLITQLKQEAAKAEVARAELEPRYMEDHPRIRQAVAKEEQAKARLAAEVRKIVASVESSYLAAQRREDELARQLEAQRGLALEQKDVGADYDTLARDVQTARDLYGVLLERLKGVDVADEIKASNVIVVDRAIVSLMPSSPRRVLNTAIAAVVGLLLAIGIAFGLEHFDNTLRTPEEVERRLRLPVLGLIPSFHVRARLPIYGLLPRSGGSDLPARRGDGVRPSSDLVVETAPRSIVSEAYRAVRTAILMSRSDAPPRVILFTSGAAGEGKTVTAVNQAVTLARAGARVLIVDADVRKPRVHRVFQLQNSLGLSTFLTGQTELDQVIHPVALNGDKDAPAPLACGLDVMPSGPLPPNPAELLGGARMRTTLETLRGRYDFILVDSPPVLPVTDAVLLSQICDGVVLVVRGQETPISVVAKSRDRLRNAQAKILGVVLNDVDVSTGDYDEYRRYSYSYYAGDDARES